MRKSCLVFARRKVDLGDGFRRKLIADQMNESFVFFGFLIVDLAARCAVVGDVRRLARNGDVQMIRLILLVTLSMVEQKFVQTDSEKESEKEKGKDQGHDEDVGRIVQ